MNWISSEPFKEHNKKSGDENNNHYYDDLDDDDEGEFHKEIKRRAITGAVVEISEEWFIGAMPWITFQLMI